MPEPEKLSERDTITLTVEEDDTNMAEKIIYSCGFLFTAHLPAQPKVLLIRKNRPAFQKGKLNGIGGHVEPGETPLDAMRREFQEEAGLDIDTWKPAAILEGPDFVVHVFYAWAGTGLFSSARAQTDEPLEALSTADIQCRDVMPNIRVLIPIALDESGISKPVRLYDGLPNEAVAETRTPAVVGG